MTSSVQSTAAAQPVDLERLVGEARLSFTQPSASLHLAGLIMAICGGMVNAVSYLDLGEHTFVSHLTGTTTKVGMRAAGYGTTPSESEREADAEEAASTLFAVLLIVAFVSGATLCGMLISRSAVSIGRSAYGLVLLISSGLLCMAVASDITEGRPTGALYAAMACGIQNGMVSSYSGNIVRTTHVTGTWTDTGVSLGRILARLLTKAVAGSRGLHRVDWAYLKADFSRFRLMFMLAMGFMSGCYMGARIHPILHKKALLVPAAILACGGIGHACYVAFVLNLSFWEILLDSVRNSQPRQVLVVIDGEVLDVSGSTHSSLLCPQNLLRPSQSSPAPSSQQPEDPKASRFLGV